MEIENKQISEMTTAELEQFLKKRKADEQKKNEKRKADYQTDKDKFLQDVVHQFKDLAVILSTLKSDVITHSENFNALKYELDGKVVKETKSFELKNDFVKIIVETQDRFEFNDQAPVHINAIKDLFKAKFENRNKAMYTLLDSILMRNSNGDYNAKLLTKARAQVRKIGDDQLTEEFDKLNDCLVVTGSAKYVRVYTKDDKNKWRDISLNFSSM